MLLFDQNYGRDSNSARIKGAPKHMHTRLKANPRRFSSWNLHKSALFHSYLMVCRVWAPQCVPRASAMWPSAGEAAAFSCRSISGASSLFAWVHWPEACLPTWNSQFSWRTCVLSSSNWGFRGTVMSHQWAQAADYLREYCRVVPERRLFYARLFARARSSLRNQLVTIDVRLPLTSIELCYTLQ